MEAVDRLLQEQKRVREERKRVNLDLKNAQRRRNRLKSRARLLSAEDLVAVMGMREIEAERKKAKVGGAAGTGKVQGQETCSGEDASTTPVDGGNAGAAAADTQEAD